MLKHIYAALREAGASEAAAGAAAEEVASYENRFTQIDVRFEKVRAKLNLLTWMVGFNLIISVGLWVAMPTTCSMHL